MKKYRLKEYYKNILKVPNPDAINDWDYWGNYFMTKEPLEEVPQRIELKMEFKTEYVYKRDGLWTKEELNICEKALNGGLLDIDSIDHNHFSNWYNDQSSAVFNCGLNIKAVLKQYLKEK
jgi:hypothetical protein